jgi:chromosome segregation ATPase
MNNHNDKEINSTKNLIEKMNKQIDSFDKNTRASNLEKAKIQKEVELNKNDIKEISKQISILLIDIKSTKSAIFDYNVKNEKIRKELNKKLGLGDNLSNEVQYLINHFGKK